MPRRYEQLFLPHQYLPLRSNVHELAMAVFQARKVSTRMNMALHLMICGRGEGVDNWVHRPYTLKVFKVCGWVLAVEDKTNE